MKNKKLIIGIVVIIAVALISFIFLNRTKTAERTYIQEELVEISIEPNKYTNRGGLNYIDSSGNYNLSGLMATDGMYDYDELSNEWYEYEEENRDYLDNYLIDFKVTDINSPLPLNYKYTNEEGELITVENIKNGDVVSLPIKTDGEGVTSTDFYVYSDKVFEGLDSIITLTPVNEKEILQEAQEEMEVTEKIKVKGEDTTCYKNNEELPCEDLKYYNELAEEIQN